MNETDIEVIVKKALKNLFNNQPNLLQFTSETNQSEWNLAHHYANEVYKYFPKYDCDVDIIKPNYHSKRPDIVVHKRGSQNDNLLVIEVKYEGNSSDEQSDIRKINEYWFVPPLKYEFGAVVNITSSAENSLFKVFKNQ